MLVGFSLDNKEPTGGAWGASVKFCPSPVTRLRERAPHPTSEVGRPERGSLALGLNVAGRVVNQTTLTPAHEDWETIQRALQGDSDALSALFSRDRTRLHHMCLSLLKNREDAEDALQDGLLSAYMNLKAFEGRSRFSTWLTRVVFNAALMKRRKQLARRQVPLRELTVEETQQPIAAAADAQPGPEQACALGEAKDLLERQMDRLSPLLRRAVELRYIDYLSTTEAAKAEGIKTSAMKSRIFRARQRLVNTIIARGLTVPCDNSRRRVSVTGCRTRPDFLKTSRRSQRRPVACTCSVSNQENRPNSGR
jgi:RNA polymerase sigma-70 factor (ECF subfamily)